MSRRGIVTFDVRARRRPTLWERVRERMTGKPPACLRRRDGAAVTLYADATSLRMTSNPIELDGRSAIDVWADAPADLELVIASPGMTPYVEAVRLA
jgi:hypothetical protein